MEFVGDPRSRRTSAGPTQRGANGDVLCYFHDARKFKARYATIGFSYSAAFDDGSMEPVVYALRHFTATQEAQIVALLEKALR
ncbi:MAG: hypothetical protein L3K00_06955 [Thermoplasmata archaeon]|nr:hypothetical protein [Thermoplasmata archaeon]